MILKCQSCSQKFSGRQDARTCSVTCRKRLQRSRSRLSNELQSVKRDFTVAKQAVESAVAGVVDSVEHELASIPVASESESGAISLGTAPTNQWPTHFEDLESAPAVIENQSTTKPEPTSFEAGQTATGTDPGGATVARSLEVAAAQPAPVGQSQGPAPPPPASAPVEIAGTAPFQSSDAAVGTAGHAAPQPELPVSTPTTGQSASEALPTQPVDQLTPSTVASQLDATPVSVEPAIPLEAPSSVVLSAPDETQPSLMAPLASHQPPPANNQLAVPGEATATQPAEPLLRLDQDQTAAAAESLDAPISQSKPASSMVINSPSETNAAFEPIEEATPAAAAGVADDFRRNFRPTLNRLFSFQQHPLAIGLTAMILIMVVGLVSYARLFGQRASFTPMSSQVDKTLTANHADRLNINRDTLIADGHAFYATGTGLFRNRVDSTSAFAIQNAASDDVLVIDTTNGRVGVGGAPVGAATFQVFGDSAASGAVSAAGGFAVLDANGLTINGNQLCNADGCLTPSQIEVSQLPDSVTLQGNSFNGPSELVQNTAAGALPALSGTNLTNLNASALTSGTIDNARLDPTVSLLGQTIESAELTDGTIVDADIAAGAAIAYDKLNLTNSVVNVDISATAAIAYSKLNLTDSIIAADLTADSVGSSEIATDAVGSDEISADAVTAIEIATGAVASAEILNGSIINEDIAAGAAIGWTKIDKAGSSLADLSVRSASDIDSGTLADARLSTNVALLDGTGPQTFTGNTRFNGTILHQNAVDSTGAFQVQNAAGTSNLLIADTTNSRIAIGQAAASYKLDVNGDINITAGNVYRINGTAVCSGAGCTAAAGSGDYIQNQTAVAQVAGFNINGSATAGSFIGDGASLTNLSGSNIASGTVADARLSANVTLQGNTFNNANQLVQLDGTTRLPVVSGVNLFDLDASNISIGTLVDARLTTNVPLKNAANIFTATNTFRRDAITAFAIQNAAGSANIFVADTNDSRIAINQATANYTLDVAGDVNIGIADEYRIGGNPICDASGCVPASGSNNYVQLQAATPGVQQTGHANISGTILAGLFSGSGASLTSLNASNVSSGTLADSRLSTTVTLQGNNFNGASQLVQLNGSTQLPAVSGVNLTNLNASNLASGTVPEARLSANVALLSGTGPQTFSGNNAFTGSLLHQNAANSTTAFQIQNSAGTSNLLIADTTNSRIAIGQAAASYALDVNGDVNLTAGNAYRINGTIVCDASGCTAGTGSGNYIQNQSVADQTADFRISGSGRANTSILTPILDTATAVGLTIAGTNATSLSLCNSAACNTVQLGTNADADAINIGDGLDTLTLTGSSASTIVFNGSTITAAELNVLDSGITLSSETNGDYVESITGGNGLT
ncbi:hypothetical protein HY380_00680, partial [Candidatus Saccharibacteria bacterium]|nr:hypothetical protein [Candidatus Saccharibacteria bacterium]